MYKVSLSAFGVLQSHFCIFLLKLALALCHELSCISHHLLLSLVKKAADVTQQLQKSPDLRLGLAARLIVL